VSKSEKDALLEWINQFQKTVESALHDQPGNKEMIMRKIRALRHAVSSTLVDNPQTPFS